ncbi:MAG TPA: hypothetical protein VH372_17320 [Actinospica sp.]|nr:hypothetical protein [Actinospica sp.]
MKGPDDPDRADSNSDAAGAGVGAGAGAEQPEFFGLRYRNTGMDRLTYRLDRLFGGGPGRSGIRVARDELRVDAVGFHLTVPRSAVRSAARSEANTHGTTGTHSRHGHWLVNGAPDGLVILRFDPPPALSPRLSSGFHRARVRSLTLSLDDPDGFLGALDRRSRATPQT